MRRNKVKRAISTIMVMMLMVGIIPINAFAFHAPMMMVNWDEYWTNEWTKNDIILEFWVSAGSDDWLREVTFPDGNKIHFSKEENMTEFSAKYTISENGSYTFKANNIFGFINEETILIKNIDKVVPTKPTIDKVDNKLVLTHGTDTLSGIDKHMYSLNGGEWLEFTTDIDITNFIPGNYTIKVKAIDNATNESEVFELNFNVDKEEVENIYNDKVLKNAERFVQMAEALNREPHITRAKNVVSILTPSEVKTSLLLRIWEIKGPISEESKALIEATTYVESAEKYGYVSIIRKAEEKVNALKDSPEKTALIERLNKLK